MVRLRATCGYLFLFDLGGSVSASALPLTCENVTGCFVFQLLCAGVYICDVPFFSNQLLSVDERRAVHNMFLFAEKGRQNTPQPAVPSPI